MNKKPVIVYGASGYTGRLVCEFLREYQIPFVAAGRNKQKLEDAMAKVPGIETANYEIAVVEHSVEALTEFFKGAKVVCNTVGPFSRFGTAVVEACLNADCHYLDTTGEQQWMIEMRDTFSEAYAEKGLLLAPSTAYMHAVGNIAAEFCLENPTIDSINAACIPTGVPTVGSTQTVMDMARNKQYWLENNELVEIVDPMKHAHEVTIPGFNSSIMALPWGGGSIPLWYANDTRVNSASSLTGFTNRPLMQGVMALAAHYEENLKDLPVEEQEAQLDAMAAGITPGMPPRENRTIHRLVDRVYGVGPKSQICVTIIGHSAYIQTGLVQAFIAKQLINKGPNNVGFQSPCKAVGHHELYGALEGFGFCDMKIEEF
ncbi:DUF5938 domain-containing protein [Thalassotalea psychrophila]|uniref:DUF5938 domain-containing protein n=1 Tax=Thalassotalea psychrophila TaxID=3065647 RepID=A0ABY9TYJ0_9GAMM|nr:DUF5938 domain-containing protein [Colwelliaceae bacterium SQ149]